MPIWRQADDFAEEGHEIHYCYDNRDQENYKTVALVLAHAKSHVIRELAVGVNISSSQIIPPRLDLLKSLQ